MSRPGTEDTGSVTVVVDVEDGATRARVPRRLTTVRVGIDDVTDPDEHGDLAQGSDVLDVVALDHELAHGKPTGRMYGWLREHRTGTRLRPATSEEFERAARAAVDDGGTGIICIGALECTVVVDD